MIAAEKRMKGERGRVGGGRGTEEEEENGIDLTLRESHRSSVHIHSSALVMVVLMWQVGGEGRWGI